MKYILSILLISICQFSFSENYKVVHLNGDIFSVSKNRNLTTGDLLSESEILKSTIKQSNCILFTGSKKLTFKQNNSLKEGNVSDLFSILPERQLIGSRSLGDSTYLKLSDYFLYSSYLFIGETEKIKLHQVSKEENSKYKYIIVDSKDNKSIINFNNNILSFSVSSIFLENEYQKDITIYKFNTVTGEFIKETKLHIEKVNLEKIIPEINAIMEMIGPNKTNAEKIDSIFSILIEIYGDLNKELFVRFMSLNYSF